MNSTNELPTIDTAHLFPKLDAKLIELLESLSPEDWIRAALPKWTVKDVAAHLLDSNVRRLSIGRDGYWGVPFKGNSAQELIEFLNGLNHNWTGACRRLSPQVLVALLKQTGADLSRYVQTLDPAGPAIFGVSWAGEEKSLNWFDIAREYTEKWHHQQQIRDAVNRPGIMTQEFYQPVVATFIRVLPHSYRNASAAEGTEIAFRVTGESGGGWALVRRADAWQLLQQSLSTPATEITIPGELVWKLFTKGLTRESARANIKVRGDQNLADPVFGATAIVG